MGGVGLGVGRGEEVEMGGWGLGGRGVGRGEEVEMGGVGLPGGLGGGQGGEEVEMGGVGLGGWGSGRVFAGVGMNVLLVALLAQLNESLYELYCGSSLFKLSVDWLDSVREPGRQSLLNQTSVHLTRLVGMTGNALKREVPPPPAPSLPVVLHSFNVLHYSFEVAARLKLYCDWSKRLLLRVMQLSRCTSALPHLRNLAC
ncbi:unnamed protein product [Boreogadus saida]